MNNVRRRWCCQCGDDLKDCVRELNRWHNLTCLFPLSAQSFLCCEGGQTFFRSLSDADFNVYNVNTKTKKTALVLLH